MKKRVVSVWLPLLPIERLRRLRSAPPAERPFALADSGSVRRIVAVDVAARRLGITVGMTVADALAVQPDLVLAPLDADADRALAEHLSDWCSQYTPWAATDLWGGGFGLWLDITGGAHLFGGEGPMVAELTARLQRLGFTARAAVADTPGAAWAWARHGSATPCLPSQGQREALAPLPVAALRLAAETLAVLQRLGLRSIGDLYPLSRAGLAARFGREVALRLDQALGHEPEPISPCRPPPDHRVHAAFAEPVGRAEDVAEAVRRLLERLCHRLEAEGAGLRRLEVTVFRVDASWRDIAIGTSRPTRGPAHLFRLLREDLPRLDPGYGVESLRLTALDVTPLPAEQATLAGGAGGGPAPAGEEEFARLLDALGNRLGFDRVARLVPQQSHLPERAVRRAPPTARPPATGWPWRRRPLHLFSRPEPVEAVAPVPDSPPLMFRWRNRSHQVVRADSAERIACEWWRSSAPERDYYVVEDQSGRRFWLFREGLYGAATPPRWFMHGIFP